MYEEAPWAYGTTHEQAAKARPVLSSGARHVSCVGHVHLGVVLPLAVCRWQFALLDCICCQAKVLLKAIDAIPETALQSRPTFLAVKAGWVGGLGLAALEVRPVACSAAQPVRPVVCSAARNCLSLAALFP